MSATEQQRILKQDGYLEVGTSLIDDSRTFFMQQHNHVPASSNHHIQTQSQNSAQLENLSLGVGRSLSLADGTRTGKDVVGGGEVHIEIRNILYHPHLNVILVLDSRNQVKIVDVHSGVILQSYKLGNSEGSITI